MRDDLRAGFERIERQKQDLLARLGDEPVAGRPAAAREWSPLQIVEHLVVYEELVDDWIQQGSRALIQRPGLKARLFLMMIGWSMRAPFRVPTMREMEPRGEADLESLRGRWEALRTRLADALEAVSAHVPDSAFALHPIGGPMSARQMIECIALHLDYHVRHWPPTGALASPAGQNRR